MVTGNSIKYQSRPLVFKPSGLPSTNGMKVNFLNGSTRLVQSAPPGRGRISSPEILSEILWRRGFGQPEVTKQIWRQTTYIQRDQAISGTKNYHAHEQNYTLEHLRHRAQMDYVNASYKVRAFCDTENIGYFRCPFNSARTNNTYKMSSLKSSEDVAHNVTSPKRDIQGEEKREHVTLWLEHCRKMDQRKKLTLIYRAKTTMFWRSFTHFLRFLEGKCFYFD